jgi:hypothetical protein
MLGKVVGLPAESAFVVSIPLLALGNENNGQSSYGTGRKESKVIPVED